jgi:hypothetical protein
MATLEFFLAAVTVLPSDLLEPRDYFMYRRIQHLESLRSSHTVYLCVLCGSQNKQRVCPYTALTDWIL